MSHPNISSSHLLRDNSAVCTLSDLYLRSLFMVISRVQKTWCVFELILYCLSWFLGFNVGAHWTASHVFMDSSFLFLLLIDVL